eukprot:12965-Heterococcus_DN1.PRE.1
MQRVVRFAAVRSLQQKCRRKLRPVGAFVIAGTGTGVGFCVGAGVGALTVCSGRLNNNISVHSEIKAHIIAPLCLACCVEVVSIRSVKTKCYAKLPAVGAGVGAIRS